MKRSLCVAATLMRKKSLVDMQNLINNFKEWKFRHPPSYSNLPIDDNPEYNVARAVKESIFSKVPTDPIPGKVRLVCASEDALVNILDLNPKVADTEEFIDFIAGKRLPEGGLSVSHRYGGFQFGFWADQLGDGRAHILGEYKNSNGENWQLQLKGSGETPYSRFGDGRAVLRSSIREMIASEACHYLGVPTTRAAALVASDEPTVWRDKNYSGMNKKERAAIVIRLAPAWYRFGSLEILNIRKEVELLRTFCDFVIKEHFPDVPFDDDRYVNWYKEVAHRNLDMVATWQGCGFTHGVLNTDNMSLLGLTIDYGPYGFMDYYDEYYIPNTSDDMGRYAFSRQPKIVLWNLEKLAIAMTPILTDAQKSDIQEIYATLQKYVDDKIRDLYTKKLGLETNEDGDGALIESLLGLMQDTTADFTATFRQLSEVDAKDLMSKTVLADKWSLNKLSSSSSWEKWVLSYQKRLEKEGVSESERQSRMQKINPVYVPRNWMLQEAIKDAEENNFDTVRLLLRILRTPYKLDEEAEARGWSSEPPNWAYCLKLSCSS